METLRVKVKPNSKKQDFQTAEDGSLSIHLKAAPVDGIEVNG